MQSDAELGAVAVWGSTAGYCSCTSCIRDIRLHRGSHQHLLNSLNSILQREDEGEWEYGLAPTVWEIKRTTFALSTTNASLRTVWYAMKAYLMEKRLDERCNMKQCTMSEYIYLHSR